MNVPRWLPWSNLGANLKANLIVTLIYFGLAELSRDLASTPNAVTPVWPPDGLAVYAAWLYGKGVLPGVFLGSFLANIQAFWNLQNGLTLLISVLAVLGIAAGTTLGTWLGTSLLRYDAQKSYPFDRVPNTVKFLAYAGMVGPIVNATVGVAMLVFAHKVPWSAYHSVWPVWWISNVAGIFILTPLLLTWNHWLRSRSPKSKLQPGNLSPQQRWMPMQGKGAEAFVLAILILLTGKVSFWNDYLLAYVLIPLLVWAAFRFGQLGATISVFVISATAVLGTVRGLGTFASDNLNQSLMGLQSFIAVIVFTSLILVAVLSEQAQAKFRLKEAFSELQVTNEILEKQTQELADNNQQLEQTLQELKNTQAQMVQSEKMSALGTLMASVAHEINNPIGFLNGSISNIKEYSADLLGHLVLYQQHYPQPAVAVQENAEEINVEFLTEDLPYLLNSMQGAVDRIKNISNSLRTFARADMEHKTLANLHDGLDSTILILKYRLQANALRPEIKVNKDYDDLPLVECFLGQLNQVFMNILANAIDAFDEMVQHASPTELSAKPQEIMIRTIALTEHNAVEIRIRDNANGMPEEVKTRVFEHLFTTKGAGKGTGLGLALALQIVTEKHHGSLEVQSELGEGTEFCIRLPIAHHTAIANPPSATSISSTQ